MQCFHKILLAIPVLWLPCSAMAAEALSLQQAEQVALSHSPRLAGANAQAEAEAAISAQAGSLPAPTLSLAALNLPVNTFSTSQEAMTQMQVGISQSLPFPGKLSLKERSAEKQAQATAQGRDEVRLRLLRDVRLAWWNLAYLDQALVVISRNQNLLRNLVEVAESRYKTGQGLQQDVLLAQQELSQLLEQQLSLQAARRKQAAGLNILLGRSSASPLDLPALPDEVPASLLDVQQLKDRAHARRPLLAAKREQLSAAADLSELADKNYYPDFKLGAAYGVRRGLNANGTRRPDLASIQISMDLPWFAGRAVDAELQQRQAEQARAGYALQDAELQVDAEIEAAAADYRSERERVQLYQQGLLPQARQTSASMLAGYQVNRVDFLNLVRARLAEFNTEIRYWQQLAAVHQAQAQLAAAVGVQNMNEVVGHE